MDVTIIHLPHLSSFIHIAYSVTIAADRDRTITVAVTRSSAYVRQWIIKTNYIHRQYLQRLVVGMGVQWSSSAPAATLQLCVGHRCLIYQLHHANANALSNLRWFLKNKKNTFVGLWNHSDRARLRASRHGLRVRRVLDLRFYVAARSAFRGWRSLQSEPTENIVRYCLGMEEMGPEREISRSNWEAEHLSLEQVKQACVDAYVSFRIGLQLRVWELDDADLRY